ncbi:MAG: type I DNA topoisomerase [Alphaproteobacteria bacterium]
MSNIVVVESPAKAKTINKYLGPDYTVLATFGHVRDLPSKDGSVRPDEGFAMTWVVNDKAEKHLKAISNALKSADNLYLATDPDREGEAISWHVLRLLEERKALNGVNVKRVVFHEITKNAVLEAMKHPRDIDRPLVDAYLARRALDYLVGFTLSPVLWRKLPGSRSAGRVQSVALRLICERESAIEVFKPREYWTVETDFSTEKGAMLTTRLTHLGGEKLTKFSLENASQAEAAVARINTLDFKVVTIERKQARRNPQAPFITSTLQQEASRKLGFGASRTMQTAQKLYEGVEIDGEMVGLITYMRTDSVQLSQDAIGAIRRFIPREYGDAYLPSSPRAYKSTARNAQEAHEGIRPTDITRLPMDGAHKLNQDQLRLYDLIWKRTVASQMENARIDQVAIDVGGGDGTVLRATGSSIAFDGFLKLYREGRDDPVNGTELAGDGDEERMLPPVNEGETMARNRVNPDQHFTQPPPRFTEASLVKRLEELGIGRPSTYASIISVLQDRDYVVLEKKRFVPVDRGRIVTSFLESFFEHYVEYDFTAQLENQLDDISSGRIDWKQVLGNFWTAFAAAVEGTKDLTITDVIDCLDAELGPHFFPDDGSGKDFRVCPACGSGRIGLKLGKYGAFIGCSGYPECKYTRKLTIMNGEPDDSVALANGPIELGIDSATGDVVSLRHGPYGLYFQKGEVEKPAKGKAKSKEKPKRVSLPKGMSPETVTLETALGLLSLPREVGKHPETDKAITAGIGRFGPYVRHGTTYASLDDADDVLTVGLNRAVDLIQSAKPKKGAAGRMREIGDHPADGKPIGLYKGRYGPYVKHGRINASVPADKSPDTLTLEDAVALLDARAQKKKGAATKKASRPRKTKAKSSAKDKATGPLSEAG